MILARLAESLEHWRRDRRHAAYNKRYAKHIAAGRKRVAIRHKRRDRKRSIRRIKRALFH